jgi:hypothetical protein
MRKNPRSPGESDRVQSSDYDGTPYLYQIVLDALDSVDLSDV